MIQNLLKQFITQWPAEHSRLKDELAKNKVFNAKLAGGNIPGKHNPNDRKKTDLSSSVTYKTLVIDLPKEMSMQLPQLSEYIVKSSIGQGGPADIPWICIFDEDITKGAQHGYYPVYLFNAYMNGVYLSLNQGWTQYENNYGSSNGRIEIRNNAAQAAQSLSHLRGFDRTPIILDSTVTLARGYELGNICSKFYSADNIPSDDVLISDLENILSLYKLLKTIVGSDILKIEELKPKQSEEQFQNAINKATPTSLPKGPIEKPAKSETAASAASGWPRKSNIAATALSEKGYACENDTAHVTFMGIKGHTFMEAHHLVPMEFQDDFDVSIDVPENILCLCPTCHRSFHNSEINLRKQLVSQAFSTSKSGLQSRGINITKKQLLKYYIK